MRSSLRDELLYLHWHGTYPSYDVFFQRSRGSIVYGHRRGDSGRGRAKGRGYGGGGLGARGSGQSIRDRQAAVFQGLLENIWTNVPIHRNLKT